MLVIHSGRVACAATPGHPGRTKPKQKAASLYRETERALYEPSVNLIWSLPFSRSLDQGLRYGAGATPGLIQGTVVAASVARFVEPRSRRLPSGSSKSWPERVNDDVGRCAGICHNFSL